MKYPIKKNGLWILGAVVCLQVGGGVRAETYSRMVDPGRAVRIGTCYLDASWQELENGNFQAAQSLASAALDLFDQTAGDFRKARVHEVLAVIAQAEGNEQLARTHAGAACLTLQTSGKVAETEACLKQIGTARQELATLDQDTIK